MKIEIWSDFACPFCYIGKRRFDEALHAFENKNGVTVRWRSFQLDPGFIPKPGQSIIDMLSEKKGWTAKESAKIHEQVSLMAEEAGLTYQFEKVVPANTFDAHRLSQLALQYNLQHEAEEILFASYFTKGKNIADQETLKQLGSTIGLPEEEIENLFNTHAYANEVSADMQEAVALGIRGVPFFIINEKYAISGAQPVTLFLEALQTAWKEKNTVSATEDAVPGDSCTVNENC